MHCATLPFTVSAFPHMSDSWQPFEWWSWHPAGSGALMSAAASGYRCFGHGQAHWLLLATSRVGHGPWYVKPALVCTFPELAGFWREIRTPGLASPPFFASLRSGQVVFSDCSTPLSPEGISSAACEHSLGGRAGSSHNLLLCVWHEHLSACQH